MSRASLWSNSQFKYGPVLLFGKTGMTRQRYDTFTNCIWFSDHPGQRPAMMTSKVYRWRWVDDFVTNFNNHHMEMYTPSHWLCDDESISRWYGMGGHWINMGLPHYVAINCKPENRCEIQNMADSISGIMLHLKVVKTTEHHSLQVYEDDSGLLHGTVVLKQLTRPWANSDRMVCADSYFASVKSCFELKNLGLRFIGVVKLATTKFPMRHLLEIKLFNCGDYQGLCHYKEEDNAQGEKEVDIMSFVWIDRKWQHFVANAESLEEGTPYTRKRWQQVDANPDFVELTIPQPKAAEVYYSVCGKIDQHNRHWQGTLMVEKKVETRKWDFRLNISIFYLYSRHMVGLYAVHYWNQDRIIE